MRIGTMTSAGLIAYFIALVLSACMPEFPDPNLGVYPCSENGTCASGYYCSSGNKCLPNWMTDTGAGGGSSDATDGTDASDASDATDSSPPPEYPEDSCGGILKCVMTTPSGVDSCVSQGTVNAQAAFTAWKECVESSCGASYFSTTCVDVVTGYHCLFACQSQQQACVGHAVPEQGICRPLCLSTAPDSSCPAGEECLDIELCEESPDVNGVCWRGADEWFEGGQGSCDAENPCPDQGWCWGWEGFR